ncbi:MAG: MerR family DNA-binding protein, partial [Spirochaetaceae bacterium]|nr:MerR family DNA-binding protein [Spirochaetaceae bacterium]
LLPFVERSDSGIRQFTDIDLEWLIIIDSLKKTGMPLKEIKEFVKMFEERDSTITRRLEIVLRHREVIQQQVAKLNEIIMALDFKEQYYRKALDEGKTKDLPDLTMEELPPELQAIRKRVRGD